MKDIVGISFDFNNVLYNLTKINIEFIKERYGIELDPLNIDRFSYYIDEGYNDIICEVWNNPDRYLTSMLYQGAKEFFDKVVELVGINNVQIVTTSLPNIIDRKNDFIKNVLGLNCTVIHTKEKHLHTRNTILIDDSIANILSHIENNKVPGIIFNLGYGWNKSLQEDNELIFRANSYNETFELISNFFNKDLSLGML